MMGNEPGSSNLTYEQQALLASQTRPGYTDPNTLGDTRTQSTRRGLEAANRALGAMGMPLVNVDEATGGILETQRQNAMRTAGTRDDQFFANEESKWMQNPVEQSSAFHNVTRTATDVKENPFELRGDLAVETLKGSPNKRSEYFSPVSGKMNQYLPGDRGLQETMWDTARDGETPQGSYMDAIAVLNGSTGGLVTGKMGSPNRGTRISSPANSVFGESQGPANESVRNHRTNR